MRAACVLIASAREIRSATDRVRSAYSSTIAPTRRQRIPASKPFRRDRSFLSENFGKLIARQS